MLFYLLLEGFPCHAAAAAVDPDRSSLLTEPDSFWSAARLTSLSDVPDDVVLLCCLFGRAHSFACDMATTETARFPPSQSCLLRTSIDERM